MDSSLFQVHLQCLAKNVVFGFVCLLVWFGFGFVFLGGSGVGVFFCFVLCFVLSKGTKMYLQNLEEESDFESLLFCVI